MFRTASFHLLPAIAGPMAAIPFLLSGGPASCWYPAEPDARAGKPDAPGARATGMWQEGF